MELLAAFGIIQNISQKREIDGGKPLDQSQEDRFKRAFQNEFGTENAHGSVSKGAASSGPDPDQGQIKIGRGEDGERISLDLAEFDLNALNPAPVQSEARLSISPDTQIGSQEVAELTGHELVSFHKETGLFSQIPELSIVAAKAPDEEPAQIKLTGNEDLSRNPGAGDVGDNRLNALSDEAASLNGSERPQPLETAAALQPQTVTVRASDVATGDLSKAPPVAPPGAPQTPIAPVQAPDEESEAASDERKPQAETRIGAARERKMETTAPTQPAISGPSKSAPAEGASVIKSETSPLPAAPRMDIGRTEAAFHSTASRIETAAATTPPVTVDAARQVIAAIKSERGASTIDVRLDPPDLGRVRIHFSMGSADAVTAMVSSERGDTLDLLRRNGGELIKALEQAGFENVKLDFSASNEHGFASGSEAQDMPFDSTNPEPSEERRVVYLSMHDNSRLDRLV